MKFTETPYRMNRDDAESTLKRLESENGRWWIDFVRMLFGIRVNIQLAHSLGYCVVYCCGTQKLALMLLPAVMQKILEPVDESATEGDLGRLFPEQCVKPLYNDPACWKALCELAGVESLADVLNENVSEEELVVEVPGQ
jgi:hypothetical protein